MSDQHILDQKWETAIRTALAEMDPLASRDDISETILRIERHANKAPCTQGQLLDRLTDRYIGANSNLVATAANMKHIRQCLKTAMRDDAFLPPKATPKMATHFLTYYGKPETALATIQELFDRIRKGEYDD